MARRDPLRLPALYAIFDPEQARGRPSAAVLEEMLRGGVEIVQVRAKTLSSRDFLALAREARALTQARSCRLVINDRVDIALACGADGVHLGQDDLPPPAARKLLPDQIIGISTHDPAQAIAAAEAGADYIGFGPMFGTRTKETGYAARGPEMLREVRRSVGIPIVAIGGITEENVAGVWANGADSAAIISDILGAEHITAKIARILAAGSRRRPAG